MPELRMTCFGPLQAALDGKPIGFETDKERALLAYLAINLEKPCHRQYLAGLFWSDQPERKALHSLRQAVSQLRKALGDDLTELSEEAFLLVTRSEIQFNPLSHVWVDALTFNQGMQQPRRRVATQSGLAGLDIRLLTKTLALYKGQFLEFFYLSGSPLFEEWALLQREEYNRLAIDGLTWLAEYHERRQEYTQARKIAVQLARLVPWDESVTAMVLRLMAIDQLWSAAHNFYYSQRRYLEQELGVSLAPEITELYTEIRQAAASNKLLPKRFPPAPHNLPMPNTAFIGRETELDAISALLADPNCRMLSLVGFGGIGKTRLALETAWEQVGLFSHGVVWVPLAGLDAPEMLVFALADALGFQFFGNDAPQIQIVNYLRTKELLLVLDNFEHLLQDFPARNLPHLQDLDQPASDSMDLVIRILEQTASTKLLVTSRQPLQLHFEHVLTVNGLEYPQDSDVGTDRIFSALQLFQQAARKAWPDLSLTEQQMDIVRICQLLQGVPLAIELAAAWVQVHTCQEITERVERDLGFIATQMRDVPERHRSLRAVFAHSWELLNPTERFALARLAIFRGGFTNQAAAQVANAVPQVLQSLVTKSLVRQEKPGRYDLHNLVRQFATEKLAEAASTERQASRRHARFYNQLLCSQTPKLNNPELVHTLAMLSSEEDNLRAAWLNLSEDGDIEAMANSLEGMYLFYEIRSHFLEGIDLFETAVKQIEEHDTDEARVLKGRLLVRLGALYTRTGQYEQADHYLSRGQEIVQELSVDQEIAFSLIARSKLLRFQGEYTPSSQQALAALEYYKQNSQLHGQAQALFELGKTDYRLGEIAIARQHLENSMALGRQAGDPRGLGETLNTLADVLCHQGNYDVAYKLFEESLAISRSLGDQYNTGVVLNNMGTIEQVQGHYDDAETLFSQSLEICRQIGDQVGEAIALGNLGEIAFGRGDFAQARVFGMQELHLGKALKDTWSTLSGFNVVAEAALGQGDLLFASQNLVEALQIALETQTLQMLTRSLVISAGVLIKQEAIQAALQVLAVVLHHPACQEDYRVKAEQWMRQAGLQPPLATEDSLDEVVNNVIGDFGISGSSASQP